MFNKWRIVLLGLVVSQGLSLVAMKKDVETQKVLLSCSAEARKELELALALQRSIELSQEEKIAQKEGYSHCCSGNTPPEFYYGARSVLDAMKPLPYCSDFPGHGYRGR